MTAPDPEIDAILAQRLGEVGRSAVPGPAGAGAAAGAAWSAKRLRTETAVASVGLGGADADLVVALLADLLGAAPVGDGSGAVTLRGTIGSGFGGMNPAYVVATVDRSAGTVTMAAHAKEGLIKQRTAEKAVRRLCEEIAP